jgi:hypothetical protein
MMTGTLQGALAGIHRNLEALDRTARRIATQAPLDDLPNDLIDLRLSEIGVAAGVRVARAADETIGTLLDVLG